MTDDTTIIPFRQPGSTIDPLTGIARDGARRVLMAALKAEADGFVAPFSADLLADGRRRVVRHGAWPERLIQTGIGPIEVRRQKARDRATGLPVEAKIGLPAGTDGTRFRVHPGDHRGDPRGPKGASGLPGRGPRERPELARLLVDLKARGLAVPPELAVGDGALAMLTFFGSPTVLASIRLPDSLPPAADRRQIHRRCRQHRSRQNQRRLIAPRHPNSSLARGK